MTHFYGRTTFLIGLFLGVLLAIFVKKSVIEKPSLSLENSRGPNGSLYDKWFKKQGLFRKNIYWDEMRYSNVTFHKECDYLYSQVKVLCLVIVKTTANFAAINDTWSKRCNTISSITIEPRHKTMPSKQDKNKSSWVMLCRYLVGVDANTFDWIFVVRDTTFAIMENFRHYVAPLDATKPHYIGYAITFWGVKYNSGDPGYGLNQAAVKMFQKAFHRERCLEDSYRNKEDFYLAKQLRQLNITPVDTSDEFGLSTFHPYSWYHMFYPAANYHMNSVFPARCCSSSSIAFQATEGSRMYTFDYLFYKLQIFASGHNGNKPFQSSVSDDEPWRKVLKEHNFTSGDITSDAYYKLWEDLINDPNSFAANLRKEQLFDYD